MLDKLALQERLRVSCNFQSCIRCYFLYKHQLYKRCFKSRLVCGLLTSQYQSKGLRSPWSSASNMGSVKHVKHSLKYVYMQYVYMLWMYV